MKTFADGAEILGKTLADRKEYKRRTGLMAERQSHLCAICKYWMHNPTFDHQAGRGMGGVWRDDRIEIDGEWHNAALCFDCNAKKGSKRYHWLNGHYVPWK